MDTKEEILKSLRKRNDLHNESIEVFCNENNLSRYEFAEKYSSDMDFKKEFDLFSKNYADERIK